MAFNEPTPTFDAIRRSLCCIVIQAINPRLRGRAATRPTVNANMEDAVTARAESSKNPSLL